MNNDFSPEAHGHPPPDARWPIPGRLNLAIALVQTLVFLGAASVFASASAWPVLLAALFVFVVTGHSCYSLLHEAEHFVLHPNRRINDGVGVWLALFFPGSFHLFRHGHLHHHRVNRTDKEAFDLALPGEPRWWKPLQLYGILTGVYYLAVISSNLILLLNPAWLERLRLGFDPSTNALLSGLNPRLRQVFRLEAAAAIGFQTLLHFACGLSLERHAILLMSWGASWSTVQYLHHYGTERDIVKGACDLRYPRWLDLLLLNHSWHARHHVNPNAPWIHLKKLGEASPGPRDSVFRAWLRQWRGPLNAKDLPGNSRHGP